MFPFRYIVSQVAKTALGLKSKQSKQRLKRYMHEKFLEIQ